MVNVLQAWLTNTALETLHVHKFGQALEQAAQGCGWVIIPGSVQKMCGCDTSGHGLAGMVVLGWQLDVMILGVFSSLWFYDSLIKPYKELLHYPRNK